MPPPRRFIFIALGYWAAHLLGFYFLSPVERICPVWPAGGVGLAILLLSPRRDWKWAVGIYAAVGLVDNLALGASVPASIAFTLANLVEIVSSALVIKPNGNDEVSFSRVRSVLRLAFAATILAGVPALIGAVTATLGTGASFVRTFSTWLIADGLGILLLTPLIVSFARPGRATREARGLETVVLAAAWVGASWLTLDSTALGPLEPQPYMLLPLLAWTALRLDGRGVATALAALGALAIVSTFAKSSVFHWGLPGSEDRLLTTQVYVAVAAVTSLLMAASSAEMKLFQRSSREDELRRCLAEAESKSNAEWLHLALDAAGMGTWEWELASNRVRWSDGVERLFGLAPGGFSGTYEAYLGLISPEDRPPLVAAIECAVRGELSEYCNEHRVVWPDGSIHWLEGKGSVQRDDEGKPLRMTGTVVEITERKRADDSQRRHETRFRRLIEHASDMIVVLNREGVIRFQSPSSVRVLGRTPEELVGRNALEFTHAEDVPTALAALGEADRPDHLPTTVKLRLRHADGSYRLVDCVGRSVPEEAADGYIVINGRDITESTALQDKLRQTQKLEALGTLAGGIAHDFNNILGAMLAFTELARLENPTNAPLNEYLREVTHAGKRATNLVRQILSFSRQQPHERKPMALGPVIDEVLKLLRPTLPATLEIDARVPESLPHVLADVTQMHQVVMNICTNAAQAMHGRGRLALSLDVLDLAPGASKPHPRLEPARYLRLSIDDTGHGMDAATLGRVFEPFFTTKGPGAGTGLGLAVAHGIVNDHDGAIAVSSTPGQGTNVTIHLPVVRAKTAIPERRASEAPLGGGERILFVDDEQALCLAAATFLERAGYRPVVYRDSEAAWRCLEQDPGSFALVVSDLTMPGLTGLDLASRVHEARPDLPILLTSGHAGGLTQQHLRELGVAELLEKPFDYALFTRTVARLVRRGPVRESLRLRAAV